MKLIIGILFSACLFGTLFFSLSSVVSASGIDSSEIVANAIDFESNVRFERLTVEDGLPHATVLSVLQDQQGFMWFATENGLVRYDGYNFTVYRHDINNPNSLSHNNTFALIESRDGLLWIGTDPGGLNVLDPQTGQFRVYRNDPNNPNSLIDNSIWSLMEDVAGNIWIGTRAGLSRLDRTTETFTNYIPDSENPRALAGTVIYRLYQDRSGTIWVASRAGLARYNSETDDFARQPGKLLGRDARRRVEPLRP
jgi:ligand-binding sensor domain-containing protein